ncbi:MAG: universal stress protein [Chitinophagaceae bacterium]
MKTIIVPTDYSPSAMNAVNYAADMALEIGAELLLLHVYQLPVAVAEVPLALVSVEDMQEGEERKMSDLKTDLEHITSGNVKINTEVRLGNVIDELGEICKKTDPFAIIMGTTGHSAIERTLFGSITLSAIKHLTWPVICVPKGKEYGGGIKKIGLACDLQNVEETIPFASITNFVKELKAEFHILNVEQQEPKPDLSEQTAILGTAVMDMNPQFHFIDHNDIEDGINEFAEKNNLDLVIAIPKKHKLLQGLFKPSSTKQLVFESHIPVMCIHE